MKLSKDSGKALTRNNWKVESVVGGGVREREKERETETVRLRQREVKSDRD